MSQFTEDKKVSKWMQSTSSGLSTFNSRNIDKYNSFSGKIGETFNTDLKKLEFKRNDTPVSSIAFGGHNNLSGSLLDNPSVGIGLASSSYKIVRQSSHYINEGSNATFRIYRSNTNGYGHVGFRTKAGTARSNSDYIYGQKIVYFSNGKSYVDVTVKTNADTAKENTEYFWGEIHAYHKGDRVHYNDSKAIQYLKDVKFNSTYTISRRSSSTINEGSNAVFRIIRNGNRSGTGQVRFYTTNGTARSGSDYSGFNRIYSFRSGQSYLDVTVKTNKTPKKTQNISTEESPHTTVVIASAVVLHKFNTSQTSHPQAQAPNTSSTDDPPQPSMRVPMLSSASSETATDHRSSPLLHQQRHRQKRQDYSGFNRIYSSVDSPTSM